MSRKTNKGTTKRRLLMDPKVWVLKVPLLLMFGEFISHCYSFSTGESTITANQSLVDGHFLVSHGGIFALGFLRPGNSGRRYVGIWFNKDPKRSVVWVANRDNPIRDACGILSFDATQNLVLNCNSSKNTTPIWSTHIARPTKGGIPNHSSVMAKLLETGNFVLLRQETQNMIWQSFDYPTHTQLPHMKVGYDPHTGVNRTLTSWKSEDDPGTGSCSYGLDPIGVPQMIVNKGSNRVWRGGPWNGLGWSGIPEMNKNVVFDFRYLETPDEISYMYNYKANYPSFASRITVNETGFLQQFGSRPGDPEWYLIWISPKDRCDPYGRCGAYSYCNPNVIMSDFECKCLPGFRPRSIQDWERKEGKGGCVRERGQDPAAACGNGARFETIHNVKVPDTNVARKNMSLSGKACEQECLQDCTCVAYTSANLSLEASKSGCITWHGDLVDIKLYSNYGGQDLHVKVDAVEFEKARKRPKGLHGAKRLWVMVTLPVFLTALILLLCYRISKLRGHAERRNHKILLLEDHKMINLPFFNMREMKSATANFSNKLGQGGFGPVFKGQLPNGQEIAVKRLSKHSCQGAEEFKNEVMLIARLQHRNLVKLLGCCIDEEETMLIYEYMPNKSLDSFIFDDSKKVLLDWNRRYEIIIGIARGILYLHQDSRLKIVHRDLKTSNILLDAEMNPKISDFGMARIFGGNQSQANTNRIVGTFGYMSPEYALDGLFSVKSDVFSFGVILLEIIIGKKNHFLYSDNPLSNLIRHIWDLWKEGRALEIVDASMGDSWQEVKVLRCIQIGLLCVQENATDRPTMSTVVVMLSNEFVLPSPKQPTFAVRRTSRDNTTYSSSTLCSNNDMTVSIVEPR